MKVYRRRHVRADTKAAAPSARVRPAGGTPLDGCSAMLYGPSNAATSQTVTSAFDSDVRITPGLRAPDTAANAPAFPIALALNHAQRPDAARSARRIRHCTLYE